MGRKGVRPRETRDSKTRTGHRAGEACTSALERVRQVAERDKDAQFTALLHHITVDRLSGHAYAGINPKAAPGVDGVTWSWYGQERGGPSSGSSLAAAPRSVPSEAISKGVHPEGGRAAAAARHRGSGGQDRPGRGRRGDERHLRVETSSASPTDSGLDAVPTMRSTHWRPGFVGRR